MKYDCDSYTQMHKRTVEKPCEDFVYTNPEVGIFMVLDGVTRIYSEYEKEPYKSAACDVNELFSSSVIAYLTEHIKDEDIEAVLRCAVKLGNEKIREYRKRKPICEWSFYPGTLGIISVVRSSRLYYISAGDSIGTLIRSGAKLFFGSEPSLDAIVLNNIGIDERYALHCNHPESPFAYTIFNGDDGVENTAFFSYIDLSPRDLLILASDGMASFVRYEKVSALLNMGAEKMIAESQKFDAPPYENCADDKSVVIIRVE